METTLVNYKMGNEKLIRVLDAASAKLRALLERQGRAHGALRVSVIGGGCSGLQYKMDLVDGPANRDILVQSNQVRVVVDPKSALFVSGSELDFSDDLQKGGFKVSNPNAVGALLLRRELFRINQPGLVYFIFCGAKNGGCVFVVWSGSQTADR